MKELRPLYTSPTCGCHHDHGHGGCGCHHDHDHSGHGHAADEVFDAATVRVERAFSEEELRARMAEAEKTGGTILRAKGIVPVHPDR
jgi:G3E family GTPase